MPTPRFSLVRLKCSDHPRISLMRRFSQRSTITLSLYASAISCRVGSFCGAWAKEGLALIAANKIDAQRESFTPLSYATLG